MIKEVGYTKDLIIMWMKNESLPPNLRSAFCRLLLRLYIDSDPYNPFTPLELTRVNL